MKSVFAKTIREIRVKKIRVSSVFNPWLKFAVERKQFFRQ